MAHDSRKRKKAAGRARRTPIAPSAKTRLMPSVTMEVVHGPVIGQDLLSMIRVAAGRAEVVSPHGAAANAPVIVLRAPERSPVVLTAQQNRVVTLMLQGRTMRQIAAALKMNVASVERHLRIIISKLAPAQALPEPKRSGRKK